MTMLLASAPAVSVAAEETRADLLAQAQAADVLSDLLTWQCNRAAARASAMGVYLKEAGKLDAFEAAKTVAPVVERPDYSQVFASALQFVKGGGDHYADPGLAKLDDAKLVRELTALQSYNLQEFIYLNKKRDAADRAKAFLDSTGEFEKYLVWAKAKAPEAAAAAAANSAASRPGAPAQQATDASVERVIDSI